MLYVPGIFHRVVKSFYFIPDWAQNFKIKVERVKIDCKPQHVNFDSLD